VSQEFPEVERVFGTAGRATTPTDNSPMGMVNTTVTAQAERGVAARHDLRRLQAEMDEALQIPGFPNTWTQPIRNRLDMLFTGIKTPVGIKVLGPDLARDQRSARTSSWSLQHVPGTRSVYAERVTQGYFTDIAIDRAAIARHGLTIEDVQDVVQSAIGGRRHPDRRGPGALSRQRALRARFRETISPALGACWSGRRRARRCRSAARGRSR
jgi:copper/silver efflux system protein